MNVDGVEFTAGDGSFVSDWFGQIERAECR